MGTLRIRKSRPSETDGRIRIRHFTGFNQRICAKCGQGVKCPPRLEACPLDATTPAPRVKEGDSCWDLEGENSTERVDDKGL